MHFVLLHFGSQNDAFFVDCKFCLLKNMCPRIDGHFDLYLMYVYNLKWWVPLKEGHTQGHHLALHPPKYPYT